MINIWMLAGGTLAAALVAAGMRFLRHRRGFIEPASSVQPVSEEWLSQARAGKEQDW